MSNLVKQYFVVPQTTESIIIDHNKLAEERIRKSLRGQDASQDMDEDGFVAGLDAPEVEQEDPEQILAEARAEADALINAARAQADSFMSEARDNANQLYQSQSREGYEAGMAQAQEEVAQIRMQLEQEYRQKAEENQAAYEQQLQMMEPDLIDVMIRVFDKVFGIQFEDKRPIILSLVDNAMHSIESAKNFHIRVSEANREYLEKHLEGLRGKVAADVAIDISSDATLPEESCRIETEHGVYDCSIDTELSNLLRDIRSLSE